MEDGVHKKLLKGASKPFLKNLDAYFNSRIQDNMDALIYNAPKESSELHQKLGFIQGLRDCREYFQSLHAEKHGNFEEN